MWRSTVLRFKRLGLQRRILLYVTAGLVVFSVLYTFVALQAIQQSTDLVFRERLLAAHTLGRKIDQGLEHIQAEIASTSQKIAPLLVADQLVQVQPHLHVLHEHWVSFDQFDSPCIILLTDAGGTVLQTEPYLPSLIGRDWGHTPNMAEAFQAQHGVVAEDVVSDPSAPRMVAFVQPVRGGSQVQGFLVGEIDRGHLGAWLEPSLEAGDEGYSFELIDGSGSAISSRPRGRLAITSPHLELVRPLWQEGKEGIVEHNRGAASHVIAFVPLAKAPWAVVIEQPKDQALTLPHKLESEFAGVGLFALLGGMALAWITTVRVVRPVNALIHASQEIAQGNLAQPLDVSGDDEVGLLARSFADMRARLQESRHEIDRWNQELEARVHRRTRELAGLVTSAHALTSTLDLDAVFETLMSETRAVIPPAEGIALFLFDAESERLVVRSCFGFKPALQDVRFQLGEGIAGKVFESRLPALLKTPGQVLAAQGGLDSQNVEHLRQGLGSRSILSSLGVPLISKGTRLGALVLSSFSSSHAFDENDVPMLQALADQASAAMENARLYAELQQKEALRSHLLEQVIQVQEEERRRIARELHDEIGQSLTSLLVGLKMAAEAPTLPQARLHVYQVKDLAGTVLDTARALARELRPSVLDDLGLVAALRRYVQEYGQRHNLQVDFQVIGLDKTRWSPQHEITLYRIIQEGLTNVAKHADARNVSVFLKSRPPYVVGIIEDDGRGFDAESMMHEYRDSGHLGLLGMKERAELLGGKLTIESKAGSGTTVFVQLPIA